MGSWRILQKRSIMLSIIAAVAAFIIISAIFTLSPSMQKFSLDANISAFSIENNKNRNDLYTSQLLLTEPSEEISLAIGDSDSPNNLEMQLEFYSALNPKPQPDFVYDHVKTFSIKSEILIIHSANMKVTIQSNAISLDTPPRIAFENVTNDVIVVAPVGQTTFNITTGYNMEVLIDGQRQGEYFYFPKFIIAHIKVKMNDAPITISSSNMVFSNNWERLSIVSTSFPVSLKLWNPKGNIGISEPYTNVSLNGAGTVLFAEMSSKTTLESLTDGENFKIHTEGSTKSLSVNDKDITDIIPKQTNWSELVVSIVGPIISGVVVYAITKTIDKRVFKN